MVSIIEKVCTKLPTKYGVYTTFLFVDPEDSLQREHCALLLGTVQKNMLLRIHSECFTGDVLGSTRCDCGEQLRLSLERIAEKKNGILLYLRQEGRGIGLAEKLRAYNLQDEGYDTVDANLRLGHQADLRNYDVAVAILQYLHVTSVDLLTNNPNKMHTLEEAGIILNKRIPLLPKKTNGLMRHYLETKAKKLGHLIDFEHESIQS